MLVYVVRPMDEGWVYFDCFTVYTPVGYLRLTMVSRRNVEL